MSTIGFFIGVFFLAIIVASKIPGLEHFVRPIVELVFYFIKLIFENGTSWTIWLFKSLWRAHLDLLENLLYKAEDIDPTINIESNH